MDGSRVVLDISSDEDAGFNWPATDGCDSDVDWTELFVNLESDAAGKKPNSDEGYESDDVVVIKEVLANPKRTKKSSGVDKLAAQLQEEDDDDCVILEGDPDKPEPEVKDSGCDSDDLVIVSEKGQVACRDYPHPRHLCVKFPFGSTLHSEYCKLCHCYVCDSPAPCASWGNANSVTDHCHATEKEELWKSARKRTKLGFAPVTSNPDTAFWRDLLCQIPTNVLSLAQNSGSNSHLPAQPPSYDPPNIIRSLRTPGLQARSRYHQLSQHSRNQRSSILQRARVPSLNPHSVTSSPISKRASIAAAASKQARHAYMVGLKRGYTNYLMGGIPSASQKTDTGQLRMGHLDGAVNLDRHQNSSAVNPSQISAGPTPSQVQATQAQLYGQPTAVANGNPSVHLNGSSNEHISAPVTSNAPCSTTSQQSQSFTAFLDLQGGEHFPTDLPNWGEPDTQILSELPVLDAEDGIYADNLWQF